MSNAGDMKPIAVEKTNHYKRIYDLNDSSNYYIGWASHGTATSLAAWRIKKINIATNVYTVTWADGNEAFDNIWDNRATLSYS